MREYDFALEKALVKKARLQHNWIFNPDNKDWYSPDEFEERFILNCPNITNASRRWMEKLTVRDPRAYPIEFIIWLEPLVSKAAKHAKAVKEWYKDNPEYMKVIR